jgi:uncharacterized cupredoxin-like copper-binding protein
MRNRTVNRNTVLLTAALLLTAAGLPGLFAASAHDSHGHYSAGEPGDPKKPARTVKVTMVEHGKKMLFEPAVVEVKRGEQIRFVLTNSGIEDHEFILATQKENRKHAEQMKKAPEMEHDDPNAKRISPFNSAEILWKFTKRGEFEYACLIPGHLEAGMLGKIIVR